MARRANYELFCCLCGSELPYKRVMEQSPNGGNLRYIEEEVGFVCKSCLDNLKDAKPPILHEAPPEPERSPSRGRFGQPDPMDAGPVRRPRTDTPPWLR